MTQPQFTPEDIDRFWSRVDRSGGDAACWPWTAGRFTEGYGAFWISGKLWKASRVAWVIVHGAIPDGLLVCHRCDNPPCANPSHPFLGTPADNTHDMVNKDRVCRTHGEDRWVAKLTDAQVVEIRRRYATGGATQEELAADYGITFQNVSMIVLDKTWAHLPSVKDIKPGINVADLRGNAKLTADDVREIRRRYAAGGITHQRIADEYGVARTVVTRIVNRVRWKNIE